MLSQGEPRDAAVNFDTYRILQQYSAFSLSQFCCIHQQLFKYWNYI